MERRSARRVWRVGVGVCLASGLALAGAWLGAPGRAFARNTAPRAADESSDKGVSRTEGSRTKSTASKESAAASKRSPKLPSGPVFLRDDDGAPNVLLYPPKNADTKRPVTVMLHGMCDEPEYECPHFARATTDQSWLVCPRANLRCEGGGSIWSFDKRFSTAIEGGVSRVSRHYPGAVEAERGRTLIGFSLGAIRGMDVAHQGAGKYRGVILIGAKIYPDAKRLRAAGVERIVLAAGEHDMMKWHMVAQTKKLVRHGFPAAFMSMGKIGHAFPADLTERMQKALSWVNGDDAAFVPSERGELAFAGEPSHPEG